MEEAALAGLAGQLWNAVAFAEHFPVLRDFFHAGGEVEHHNETLDLAQKVRSHLETHGETEKSVLHASVGCEDGRRFNALCKALLRRDRVKERRDGKQVFYSV